MDGCHRRRSGRCVLIPASARPRSRSRRSHNGCAAGAGKRVLYAVPRHRLGEKIDEQFTAHGINARDFYGRDIRSTALRSRQAQDRADARCACGLRRSRWPWRPSGRHHQDLLQGRQDRVPAQSRCGYFRQQEDSEAVQVWIVASDMLFHAQKVLGKPAVVIVDERSGSKGIRGVEDDEKIGGRARQSLQRRCAQLDGCR